MEAPRPQPLTPQQQAQQLTLLQRLFPDQPGILRKFIYGLTDIPHQAYETGQMPTVPQALGYSMNALSGGAFAPAAGGLGTFAGKLSQPELQAIWDLARHGGERAAEAIPYAHQMGQSVLDDINMTYGMQGTQPGTVVTEPAVPDLKATLAARAQQMELAPKERIQPDVQPVPISTYQQAATQNKDLSDLYPRAEPGQYPKDNRIAPLIDNKEAIAQGLAARMQSELGQSTQFFYHTQPIVDWAKSIGIPTDKAEAWLNSFAKNYAAFSPRTETAQNIRNASLAMAKEKAGIPLTDVVGPGTGGISEKGYPMMIGEGGIHKILSEAASSPGGIDRMSNPKPYFFSQNVAGNLGAVTVDTHAIRAALDVQNELKPGSIEQWIKPQFKDAYKSDPSQLNPATWIDDTLAGKTVKGKYSQVEYGPFADVYHRAADILGVAPAEAQSMGWFASGARTGLASQRKTILDLMNERIDVTARAMGWSPKKAAKMLFNRDISLLSGSPAPLPMPATSTDQQRAQMLQNLPAIMGNRS